MKLKVVHLVRIDKYLWSIRIFKTRSLASKACTAGRVKIEGRNVKASYSPKIGETITIQKGQEKKVVKVRQLIANRVNATLASMCYEDFSPPPVASPKKMDSAFFTIPVAPRERGTGRPTKKERRTLDKYRD
ncbi:MAG: RNA-binding S4 domain-containing protein, partial [Chitinophagales bacterium]